MSDRLVTVATFPDTIQANLARNRLLDAGIPACLIDEALVGNLWHLGYALGGVKLQVQERHVELAAQVLEQDRADDAQLPAASNPTSEADADVDADAPPEDDAILELTSREKDAVRAFRAAMFGLLCMPLHLLAFGLLLKVFVSDERLAPRKRVLAWVSLVLCMPFVLLMVFLAFLFAKFELGLFQ